MFKLENAIIPAPIDIEDKGNVLMLGEVSEGCYKINICTDGMCAESGKKIIIDTFEGFWLFECDNGYPITLQTVENYVHFDTSHSHEAYCIEISSEGAILTGKGDAGTFYAAVSFAKLIHKVGNMICLPECVILDYPHFPVRGHFVECRWGSDFLTLKEWKQIIDEFADAKINTVTVGLYGCWSVQYDNTPSEYQYIPFKSHPELKTPRCTKYYSALDRKMHTQIDVLPTMYVEDYFGELIAYGKAKNVKVFPLFNSLGHNSLIPRLHPEITPLDENGNRTGENLFCISDEKTYELMFELYDEIIDRYLVPNGIDSFEIGLDEIGEYKCYCDGCRDKDAGDLLVNYIIRIAKHMKQKGIKNLYVYHDMLFNLGRLNEKTAELFKKEDVWDIIVIDYWNYTCNEKFFDNKANEIKNFFRSIVKPMAGGYYFWSMMSHSIGNVEEMVAFTEGKDFEGIISYASYDDLYDLAFKHYAQNAWCPGTKTASEIMRMYAQREFPQADGAYEILEDCMDFMHTRHDEQHLATQFFNFYFSSYFNPKVYPQNYPAKRFKAMNKNEEKYLGYLNDVLPRAKRAYEFFNKNTSGRIGKLWELANLGYVAHCDAYLTMYKCDEAYNKGKLSLEIYLKEIDRLVLQYEKYMALSETLRVEANKYITLRNISIERQFLLDIKEYILDPMTKGEKVVLELSECRPLLSKASWFLR